MQKAEEMSLSAAKHSNLKFEQGCVTIEFWWDQFLNSTMLNKEIEHYQLGTQAANSTRIAAMLLGSGLWHAKDVGPTFLDNFKQSVDSISASLPHNIRDTKGVLLPPSASHDLIIFAPVPLPIQSQLDPIRAARLTPRKIQAMNNYLRGSANKDGIEVLWSYNLMTWQQPSAHEEDGIHVTSNVADRKADIFLNMRCNSEPSLDRYPFDKTCCNFQPSINRQQQFLLLIAAITALYALYGSTKPQADDNSGLGTLATSPETRAAGILAIAVLYCFVADRTVIFDRFQKVPSQPTFLQLTAMSMIGGLFTVRRLGRASIIISEKPTEAMPAHTFLSKGQTDEWKGWMQFVILIYHYTGMSSVLWVYQIVRLLVASYLFMTGYGHTVYFLKTNNFSLKRVASVLIRLNLLSCLLAYFMRTNFDTYYFPALSSFWFLVVFLTIRIRHQPDVVPRLLVLKILVSALVVRLLVRTPGILELVFKFLHDTCNMNLDVHEFRFRLSLDAYIVYAGMFAGVMYLQLTGGLPCSTTCLATQIKRMPITVHIVAVVASIVVLPTYFIVVRRCADKYDYNWWHPIISPLPVLALVVLRNASHLFRDFHVGLFAWLGRSSLETFILQYHIWLAADTKALLSLGLWTRHSVEGVDWSDKIALWSEFIVVTVLFFWTSSAVSHATNVLTSLIVEGEGNTEAPALLRFIRWDAERGIVGQNSLNPSPRGHSRNRSNPVKEGYEARKGTNAPVLLNQEDIGNKKRSSLPVRMMVILLLMWIGNWVRCHIKRFDSLVQTNLFKVYS